MNLRRSFKLLLLIFLFTGLCSCATLAERKTDGGTRFNSRVLWFRQPAGSWNEGLPFGNGHIGGMVGGGFPAERVALNHTRLWREAAWKGRTNPDVAHKLPEIRKLFFSGDLIKAGNAANERLGVQTGLDSDDGPGPYQPVGDLNVRLAGHETVSDYRRELDLSTGVIKVSYAINGVAYLREIFASRTAEVVIVRVSADKPGSVTAAVSLSRVDDPDCELTEWTKGNRIGMDGTFTEGVRFAASAAVLNSGGTMRFTDDHKAQMTVTSADEIVILVSMVPCKWAQDLQAYNQARLEKIARHFDYSKQLHEHVDAHRRLYGRVAIRLGSESKNSLPTDERLARLASGESDPGLLALYFQFGRYLLMSGSRKGGAPLNLQGMWNEALRPPWNADLHHDCNLQMNYWMAENTNLSECAEPLFDYVESMLPNAREAAKKLYGCRGIWVGLTGGPSAKCLKSSGAWSEWTGAAAWLAQHFWWRWEYTGDKQFLRDRAYPLYKELGLFYEDFLVKDPRTDSPHFGKLVTVPSQSPENHFVGGIQPVSLCVGAAMDFQLIHEIFTNLLEASAILGTDADRRTGWQYILDNIPPLQVGKHGQLQEWLEDYEEAEVHHRHISHLYALFPGDQITVEQNPDLARAARISLDRRLADPDHISPWPAARAWYGAVYARMRQGDLAHDLLCGSLTSAQMVAANMFSVLWGSTFQIDGNFAGPALIAEMLLQSHNGQIRLLPALPAAWPRGTVKGLVARGGFDVAIDWEAGQWTKAVITSRLGRKCRLRCSEAVEISRNGMNVKTRRSEKSIVEFNTRRGENYEMTPNRKAGNLSMGQAAQAPVR